MVTITGKVLRILPFKDIKSGGDSAKKVVDLIIADESDYQRVSFWDDKAELVMSHEIKAGDVISIANASASKARAEGEKRAHAGKYARISKIAADVEPLRHANAMKLTVLAVARPEQGQVCIAGIDAENGEWIRPQGVYESDMANVPPFKNLCVSSLYVDAWRGRRPREEDRFCVFLPSLLSPFTYLNRVTISPHPSADFAKAYSFA